MANFREKAKKLNSQGGVPFMEGREKGEFFPLDSTVTVDNYGYIKGDDGDYVVLSFKEFPKNFFFGGGVVTEKFMKLDEELVGGEKEEMLAEGLPVMFMERKSKSKRTYTTCEFYPDEAV